MRLAPSERNWEIRGYGFRARASGAPRNDRALLRRDPLPDCGIHLRQHLFGEQDHVAAAKLAVLPVLAGKQQRAEVADLLAEREDLIGDATGRAPEHQLLAHRID